ncbi:Broad-complex core protein isoform 6 [Eufriesea mexicana]|nr:Broad-complex core protein isoform 6 [Eufriesea mexicana]
MRLSHPLHGNLLPPGVCYTCDVCGKTLSTKLTLKRHKEQQHFQPLNSAVCALCHKVFRTLNSLNNHKSIYHLLTSMTGLTLNSLNTQSAKKLFTCQLCGKVLCSKASLKRHVADKHAERQEEYRCVICERVYCSRNSLMTHIECPYCRRNFSCYYSLKRHFQDKHEQSDTPYVCEFCNRTYRTKNSLTTHKSLQHRGSSGMLKRLLKTTAIKNVLGSMQQAQMQQQPQ